MRASRPTGAESSRVAGAHDPGERNVGCARWETTTRLAAYARLAVQVGVNLQPGQRLAINALVEHAPLVRAVAREAYEAGRALRRRPLRRPARAARAHRARPRRRARLVAAVARRAARRRSARDGGALLAITRQPEPEIFADLDGGRVARARDARRSPRRACGSPTASATGRSSRSRTRAGRSTVFGEPDVERLWEAVATAVRLDEPDPVAAWQRAHREARRGARRR